MSPIRLLIDPFQRTKTAAWASAFLLVCLYSVYIFLLLSPKVGIDDANITQTYAASFAHSLEFTYYPGGERVEGSTSLLWTLINAMMFALPGSAEIQLAGICFALTALTVRNCWWIGYWVFLADTEAKPTVYTLLFLLALASIPSFFAWSIWPLMDISIWLTILSAILLFSVQQLRNGAHVFEGAQKFWFTLSVAMLSVCRPEGGAIAFGILLYLCGFAWLKRNRSAVRTYLLMLAIVIFAVSTVTIWRLSYFGVPFPNTFYAKVSTHFVEQAFFGLWYLSWYLVSDFNLIRFATFFGLMVWWISVRENCRLWLFRPDTFLVLFGLGIFTLYVLLGGDHFDSFRFFQPAHLVMVPCIAGGFAFILSASSWVKYRTRVFSCFGVFVIASVVSFTSDKGNLEFDFDLAEGGRELGERLNRLDTETSLAVIPAGGISRTYRSGPIYDLMGLNWRDMAHATKDLTNTPKNHGAFSSDVFWQVRPDIVTPILQDCDVSADYPGRFSKLVLKGLYDTERFQNAYERVCAHGVLMFVRQDVRDRIVTELAGEPLSSDHVGLEPSRF